MKGTEELLRQRHREREGWLIDYNQWDRSRLPKMLSIPLAKLRSYVARRVVSELLGKSGVSDQ